MNFKPTVSWPKAILAVLLTIICGLLGTFLWAAAIELMRFNKEEPGMLPFFGLMLILAAAAVFGNPDRKS